MEHDPRRSQHRPPESADREVTPIGNRNQAICDGLSLWICPICEQPLRPDEHVRQEYVRLREGRGWAAGRRPQRAWYLHDLCWRELLRRRAGR